MNDQPFLNHAEFELAGSKTGGDLATIMQSMTGVSPLDIMNVRLIIEPQATAAAASNASEAAIAGIIEAHEEATKSLDMEVFERWDAELHKRIFTSTRNEFLTNLHDILKVIRNRGSWLEIKRRTFSEARRLAYCDDHQLIVVALKARNPEEASKAMRAHLAAVSHNLFGGDAVK
jgi:DNA-binding FadR family transcriptional regulator